MLVFNWQVYPLFLHYTFQSSIMIKKLPFLLLLFPLLIWSQNDTIFKGKIVSESNYLEDIHIINVSKKIGVLSERGGYFKILASINDTLMFSAVHLKGYQRIVVPEDFKKELVFLLFIICLNKKLTLFLQCRINLNKNEKIFYAVFNI